jgi:endogenous inhibitor of DNA gyrase (YacG/DUF329 family)
MADLGRWLGGHYRVPGASAADPAEDPDDPGAGARDETSEGNQ